MTYVSKLLAGVVMLVFIILPTFSAGTIYVKHDAVGAADGSSWDDAYTDLQPAIDGASSGDDIWVAQGSYTPTSWPNGGSAARDRHFSLKNGVSIYGGFLGTEDFLSDRAPSVNTTVFSGDFLADDLVTGIGGSLVITGNTENAYQVFYHPVGTNLDSTAVLDGVTISGGNADGATAATNGGGGMDNVYCNPIIANCTFTANTAGENGGGVRNTNSSPVFVLCVFSKNVSGNLGGAIQNTDSSPKFDRCDITGNLATTAGGGVSNAAAGATFVNCTISDNQAGDGGGVYSDLSKVTLMECTVSGNSATTDGGGLMAIESFPVLTNCTLSGNTADSGGAIFSGASSGPTLMNCTVSGNDAVGFGGGLDNANATSTPIISNSIFWGNLAANNPEISGGTPTVTYSIVQGGFTGTGNLAVDPVLGALQDNGGYVSTMAIDPSGPAIDAAAPTGTPSIDARGYKRDTTPDVGAFELGAIQAFRVTYVVSGYGRLTGETTQSVFAGEDATPVTAVPDTNFTLVNWTVDGTEYSTDNPLTVTGVTEDMTVTAVFAYKTYAFVSSSGSGGRILPFGTISVPEGKSQSYSIIPEYGFGIESVLVDGVSVGPVSTYTFSDADQDHTISVTFFVRDRDGNGSCQLGATPTGALNLGLLLLLCAGLVLRSSLVKRHH